jgi:hypothetical protein
MHALGADSTQVAPSGDERVVWQSWSDGGSLEHPLAALADGTITASFAREFALTMSVQGMGTVTPGSGWVGEMAPVTIEALPDSGWTFASWIGSGSGSYSGVANPVVIQASGPVTETAVFQSAATAAPSGPPTPLRLEALVRSAGRAGSIELVIGLPEAGVVDIEMVTVAGRRLLQERITLPSGWHTRGIGSGNERVQSVPSGVYFVRVSTIEERVTRKLVVVR